MSHRVIGLDLGASSIKAAQVLRAPDGTFVVEHQAARPVPRGAIYDGRIADEHRETIATILRDMFGDEPFATKDVVIGFNSSASVFMDEILTPVISPEDQPKAMPLIIEALDGVSSENNEFSWTVTGEVSTEDGPRLKVLVYRVFSAYAQRVTEVVESAGLNVVGADLNALAGLRAIHIYPRPDRQVDAIVDIGATVVTVLLHHNGVPRMLTLDADNAGEVATRGILEALDLDEGHEDRAEYQKINDEASVGLVTQARSDYCQSLASRLAAIFRSNIGRFDDVDMLASVSLVGGGALISGLGYALREALGPSVDLTYVNVDPRITGKAGAAIQRQESVSGGDYLVAVGLGTGDVF